MLKISESNYKNGVPQTIMVSLTLIVENMLSSGKRVPRMVSITRHLRLKGGIYTGRSLSNQFIQWGKLDEETGKPELSIPQMFKESHQAFVDIKKKQADAKVSQLHQDTLPKAA